MDVTRLDFAPGSFDAASFDGKTEEYIPEAGLELVRAHGASIAVSDHAPCGARFDLRFWLAG